MGAHTHKTNKQKLEVKLLKELLLFIIRNRIWGREWLRAHTFNHSIQKVETGEFEWRDASNAPQQMGAPQVSEGQTVSWLCHLYMMGFHQTFKPTSSRISFKSFILLQKYIICFPQLWFLFYYKYYSKYTCHIKTIL